MIGRLLIAGVAILGLGACGDSARDSGSGDAVPVSPAPGDYTATGLPGPFGEGDTLRMTVREGEISAQATCNILGGNADWSGGVLTVSATAMTEMGCPGQGHAQDEWLVDFLTSAPAYDVAGDSFTLRRGEERIRMVPAGRAGTSDGSADVSLAGTRWRLTGIEQTDGDSVSLRMVDEPQSGLRIRGGEIDFGTTCNLAGGEVRVIGDRLRLRQVGVTLMGCLSERGRIERDVLQVMRRWVEWRIDGDRLRLTRGDLSLLYRAR